MTTLFPMIAFQWSETLTQNKKTDLYIGVKCYWEVREISCNMYCANIKCSGKEKHE